jgi:hypothetical protein
MGTDSTTAHQTPDERAERIAGLRALADLLESRPEIPVPDSLSGQYSVLAFRYNRGDSIRLDFAQRMAEGARIAALLGLELNERVARLPLGGNVQYVVHVAPEEEPEPADVADLLLPPIFTTPAAPPPPVGGPSHPDGPAIPGLGGAPEDWKLTDGEADFILGLLEHDAKLRGYEDRGASA